MKTLHFHISEPFEGYVMFSFFSFRDGELHIGQCQSCPVEDLHQYRAHLVESGWSEGSYKYVNGRAVLQRSA